MAMETGFTHVFYFDVISSEQQQMILHMGTDLDFREGLQHKIKAMVCARR